MNDIESTKSRSLQPYRPIKRGSCKYDVLREAEAAVRNLINISGTVKTKDLFTMTITATTVKGDGMDKGENEEQFLIDLIFKPNENGLRPRPEETQLILAHISEILRELEEDSQKTNRTNFE